MTTNTTTLAGCIERIRELLSTIRILPTDPSGRVIGFPRDGWIEPRFGLEYDALRRVVTCGHANSSWRCFSQKHPHSRAAYWEAAEQCDPGALEGAITRATSELIRFDSTFLAFDDKWYTHYYTNQNGGWSLAIYLSSGVTRTEAVLQAVVAALEVV